jgi:hypothetical protein
MHPSDEEQSHQLKEFMQQLREQISYMYRASATETGPRVTGTYVHPLQKKSLLLKEQIHQLQEQIYQLQEQSHQLRTSASGTESLAKRTDTPATGTMLQLQEQSLG